METTQLLLTISTVPEETQLTIQTSLPSLSTVIGTGIQIKDVTVPSELLVEFLELLVQQTLTR